VGVIAILLSVLNREIKSSHLQCASVLVIGVIVQHDTRCCSLIHILTNTTPILILHLGLVKKCFRKQLSLH
jgi:hypothetical protein